jgi:hypothetical protein
VDMMDHCKSENPDHLQRICRVYLAFLTPSIVVAWEDDGLVMKDGAVLHP